MITKVLPPRMRTLAREVESALEALPGVSRAWMWGQRNFKVGKRLFVSYAALPKGIILEFKVTPERAREIRKTAIGRGKPWGNLGVSGWVLVKLSRRSDLPRVLDWVKASRALYPGA